MRVLAYLFNKGDVGANQYVIQHKANIPMQEYNRFRGFLEDLCQLELLRKREEETGGPKPRAIYMITENGRTTVNTYRLTHAHLQKLFGSVEDLF